MRKTPLNNIHHALGARLVDFHGWEMPLHYGSQLEEHLKVRNSAGMFDVSHMCPVDICGSHARQFLSTLLSRSLSRATHSGKALYSCMLNEQGGIIDDLIVFYFDEYFFRLIVNASTEEKVMVWLEQHRAAPITALKITLRRDLAMIAVQGPEACQRVWQALPETQGNSSKLKRYFSCLIGETQITRTGYTGEDGFELLLPGEQAEPVWKKLLDVGVAPCGLGARDTLRLEAGLNLYGADMDETTTPYESNLGWVVDDNEDHLFIGQQALHEKQAQYRLTGLMLEPGAGILRAGQTVFSIHGSGKITSGTFSPTLNRSIALARLPVNIACDEPVFVEIRGKRTDAQVTDPPFVRR